MRIEDLNAINRSTLALIEARRAGAKISTSTPYFGYVDIDIYECPPFVMFTNNDAPVVDTIIATGAYEMQSIKLWCRLTRTATGILDIGANIGVYSLCAAALRPDLKIHAFEPNPYAYSRLRMHKELNQLDNLVEHPCAVGDKNSYVKLRWFKKPHGTIPSGSSVGLSEKGNVEECIVPLAKLDGTGLASTIGDRPLLKIDVEGAEVVAFDGLNEIVALRPDIILETFTDEACRILTDRLRPLGYSFYKVLERERRVVMQDRLIPCVYDGNHEFNQLLTTKSPEEIDRLLA